MSDEERRSSPRRRVLKGGHIVFNAGRSTIDCVMRNVSEGGALLKVTSVLGIPSEFELVLADGNRHQCRIVRKAGDTLAVAFVTGKG